MLIGQAAALSGLTRKAIRHYESIGLIHAAVRQGNYRTYSNHDVMVLKMIRRAKELGFSLNEITELANKKTQDKKLPLELACQLLDQKHAQLTHTIEQLKRQESNLIQFKADLLKNFA